MWSKMHPSLPYVLLTVVGVALAYALSPGFGKLVLAVVTGCIVFFGLIMAFLSLDEGFRE